MFNLTFEPGAALKNVVVLDGADGFETFKRGLGFSQGFETAHGIKQFLKSRMIPLDSVVPILPVNVAHLITWVTVSVECRQNIAVAGVALCNLWSELHHPPLNSGSINLGAAFGQQISNIPIGKRTSAWPAHG